LSLSVNNKKFKTLGIHPAKAAAALCVLTAACTTAPPAPPEVEGWHPVLLPGKHRTIYARAFKEGRWAVAATADSSASLWRRKVDVAPEALGRVRLSWWVEALNPQADVTDADRSDAVVRVIFAFEGDRSQLSARTRAMFEIARALTGEEPPYASLVYTWDNHAEVGSIQHDPRTDRIRKIVLDSGPRHLRRWREHERDLAADYRRAFGEEPGRLVAIALMTDADNTSARAQAWYGPVELHRRR
jgi:hypothetical protein